MIRRIRGGETTSNEHTMMSNCKYFIQVFSYRAADWALDYNTLSDEEIMDINVSSLSSCGFCFLWVINSKIQMGFECLNKWGFTFIDKV